MKLATNRRRDQRRIFLIISLVAIISLFHFTMRQSLSYYHIVLRELYFLPILLAAFWFGMKGGFITSGSISVFYVPLVVMHWQNFSPEDLDKLLETILFNVVALVLGSLSDQEKKREQEKRKTILAMAGTIAHELNSPLQVVLGNSQLLQDDFEPESEVHNELEIIIKNTRMIRTVVNKISFLDQFDMKNYAGEAHILDISSVPEKPDRKTLSAYSQSEV